MQNMLTSIASRHVSFSRLASREDNKVKWLVLRFFACFLVGVLARTRSLYHQAKYHQHSIAYRMQS